MRLPLKMGFVATLVALGAFALLASVRPLSALDAALASLIAGAVSGGCTYLLVVRRVSVARERLNLLRQHKFQEERAREPSRGDELDGLLWEIGRTGSATEKEIRKLQKMENYRREFLGNVSHELKTPIFAVQGFAETLLDGAIEDEEVRRSFVEKILRNATRLGNLARDLSEISRFETGEVQLNRAAFDVERLIREVAESLELQADEQQVQLRWQVAEGLPPVFADREAIRHVLINLVDNAIKYNRRGGRVEIVARRAGKDAVRFSVVDNGIGVAAEDIPRLTERFYRVDKSRSRGQGGTGLGLSIVKHFLAAHDIKLMVDSSVGRGSTFGFTLPATPRAPA